MRMRDVSAIAVLVRTVSCLHLPYLSHLDEVDLVSLVEHTALRLLRERLLDLIGILRRIREPGGRAVDVAEPGRHRGGR
jgi:hypothetical protein